MQNGRIRKAFDALRIGQAVIRCIGTNWGTGLKAVVRGEAIKLPQLEKHQPRFA
jgi:hypothetical protein